MGWMVGLNQVKSARSTGKFCSQLKSIKIVDIEGGCQYAANLLKVFGHFEFLSGAADGEIVDEDVPLLDCPLCNTANLSELQIP